MIYVIGHPLFHAFVPSNFSNPPKAGTVDMCFHNCFLVVQHPSTTAQAPPVNHDGLEFCSYEEYCGTLLANRQNPKLVATV